jgi:hypothetical protein
MKRIAACALTTIGLVALPNAGSASETSSTVPESVGGAIQFTIRICEGTDQLQLWFNDEAREHWNNCATPIPDVPVFLVTDSGKRSEGKTGKDGVAMIPEVTLQPNEKFRMAMACTTHNCFSIRGLFVGAPDIIPGMNRLYAETVARHDQQKQ